MKRLFHQVGALLLSLSLLSVPATAQIDPSVSGLPAATSLGDNDVIELRQGGQKKSTTLNQIFATAQSRLTRAANRAAASNPEDADVTTDGTLTVATSADAALTRIYGATAGGSALTSTTVLQVARFTGGRPTLNPNSRLNFPVSSIAPATNGSLAGSLPATPSYQAGGWEMEFGTTATKVQIRVGANAAHGFRLLVDDRYLGTKAVTQFPASSSQTYVTVEFASTKPHRIRLEGMSQTEVIHVAVAPTASVWKPTARAAVTAFITGDSYAEGVSATFPGLLSYAKAAGRKLGWTDVRQVAVGSTGYLSNASGARSTIRQQVADWFVVNSDINPADVDVVVIAAGYNDLTFGAAAVQVEAFLTYRAIRAACPNAMIFVLGTHAGRRGPDAPTLAIEDAIKTAVAQFADARTRFVPLASDVSPWTFGTGYVGAANGTGNSDVAISTDGVHLSDLGHALYGERLAAAIREALARGGTPVSFNIDLPKLPAAANDNRSSNCAAA